MEEVVNFIAELILKVVPLEKQAIVIVVVSILLTISEIVGLNDKWKSNSIVQLVHKGLVMLKDLFLKKKAEAPKVEEKK